MKTKFTIFVALFAFAFVSNAQKGSVENPKIKTNVDSISYALGSLIGADLKNGGFSEINSPTPTLLFKL